jgi:hypothetical protein
MRRRHLLLSGLIVVATGGGAAFWFLGLEPVIAHRRWYDRVRRGILSLLPRRPPDVGPGAWEFAVGWTMNLHGNCGSAHTWVDRSGADQFAEELDRRLGGPVGLATIDWIWDEYARFSRGGERYSSQYRPTRSSDMEGAQPGCFGLHTK